VSGRSGTFSRVGDLPQTIPVFPLTGVLLLPRGKLPLNIFEPRYLAMIDDALAARDRLIGMIQPREPGTEGMTRGGIVPPPPPLYQTGCAGRITSFSEAEDGRYLITLSGICRFDLGEELPTPRGYRRVVPSFARWQDDLAAETTGATVGAFDRDRLVRGLRAYFAARNITVDWNAITETPDERLVTMLAMLCPFAPQEKQALLEYPTTAERARGMTTLIEMAIAGTDEATARH
jgi:Lon protease-like protein